MKKLLVIPAVGSLLLVANAATALAMPSPGGGSNFGEHVSAMAGNMTPQHAEQMEMSFGECVSGMANGTMAMADQSMPADGSCPAHQ